MKLKYIVIVTLCATALFSSCTKVNEFLSEEPSKNSMKPIKTVEQLDAIFASYCVYPVKFTMNQNDMMYASDDFAVLPLVQDHYSRGFTITLLPYMLWGDNNPDTGSHTWGAEYTKVYYANLVLDNLDKVEGSQEQKDLLRAEAHFLRAHCYFQLALAHCLYYDGNNGDELGVTLKKTSNFEEDLHRASLKETWDFIDEELQEALKISRPYIRKDGKHINWRGSTGSVNAFAARYYLYRADYENAKKYAQKALSEFDEFVDYNDPNQVTYNSYKRAVTLSDTGETVYVNYVNFWIQLDTYFEMESNLEALLGWKELFFARTMKSGSPWTIPSQELLDTFAEDCPGGDKQNDLRYKYFMQENQSVATLTDKTSDNLYPGYIQYMSDIFAGPTVAEMHLILAECAARSGDASGAMAQVNALRKNRIAKAVYQDLTASSASVALKKVLQERRRETPFSIRWYDLKRLNATDPDNKVTIKRRFYKYTTSSVLKGEPVIEYTLEPNSRHYAIPIPQDEIDKSGGVLEQNTY